MNHEALSESSLAAVQLDLLHAGSVLLLGATMVTLGYTLLVLLSFLVVGVRRAATGRASRRARGVDPWRAERLS